MDRFEELRAFVRIAERGSFSLAGEDLLIPRATMSNLIKRLEQRVGVRLLERTTRQVRLTHDGEAYYQRCLRLLADLDEMDTAFQAAAPRGLLRVNLPGILARLVVVPQLADFVARYPEIEIYLGEDDRLVDLVREGVDCVLRVGQLQDSSLIARPVASLQQVTVASPAYLQKYGEPQSIAQLEQHLAVNYMSSATGKAIPLEFNVGGSWVEVLPRAIVSVTGTDLYTGVALSGLGLIQVPRYRIASELAAGQLQIVLAAYPPPPMQVSLLYPYNRQLSLRVRAFTQWVSGIFAAARL